MSAEILTITPTSGEAPEVYFGEHFLNPLWVEFVNNNFTKWYGCFPSDYPNVLNKVLVDSSNNSAFVVSGGVGYLINLNNRELKYKTKDYPLIVSVIGTTSPEYFVAGTFFNVYVLNSDSLLKEISPDYIIDGIYFKSQIGGKLIGDLATAENQYDYNMDFEFDLGTFELKLNKRIIRKDFKIFETVKAVDKDWIENPNLIRRLINKLLNK